MGHNGSSCILLILVSIVVPGNCLDKKRCDEEEAKEEVDVEEEHEFLGVLTLITVTPT